MTAFFIRSLVQLAASVMAASVLVSAQQAPAGQPAATPPAPAGQPASGPPAPGPDAAPPAEPYAYDPESRRDPFVSLLSRGADQVAGRKSGGLSGLATGDVMLRGVLESRGAYLAMVSGPDGKTYVARANDRLLDGVIRTVAPTGIVIMQEVNDPLSLVKQREVRKGLRTAEDAK